MRAIELNQSASALTHPKKEFECPKMEWAKASEALEGRPRKNHHSPVPLYEIGLSPEEGFLQDLYVVCRNQAISIEQDEGLFGRCCDA
ncbi:MAG TPA: hypothetical protein VEO96_08105 [Thermoplasmata archaeon]|nr:hypothetical protein [Thermoplasmata archaeon]